MYKSVLDYMLKVVEEKRDDVAVIHNSESITFSELENKSNRLAIFLRSNYSINVPVAVFLPKEINAVVADIGILKANCPFMNLDIKTPKERIHNILKQVQPQLIISRKDIYLDADNNGIDADWIDIEDVLNSKTDEGISDCERSYIDTDLMCIINTSGSTGTPKSVALNHRSFIDFMRWSDEEYNFDGSEVIGSLSPAVFDIFVFELCMMMYKGSKIVLFDNTLALFPVKLLQEMNAQKVNFIFWVPSIMVNIANMDLLHRIPLTSLKTVWFAGEVFPTKQFCYWYDNLPDVDFSNLYGPIEITLDCTFYRINERPNEHEALPIGIACNNTDVLILNEDNKKCKVEEEGELCVRGTSLAVGYYNNPEKTQLAFVQNPLNDKYPELIYRTGDVVYKDADGIIHFKGRKDSLIKHLGYRIELGEIEHVILNEIRIIKYGCAVYDYENKKIVLFYEGDRIPDKDFRSSIKQYFPEYMIPGVYINKEELPRNNNGKIDRNMLAEEVKNGYSIEDT